jgi:hypothetical protein
MVEIHRRVKACGGPGEEEAEDGWFHKSENGPGDGGPSAFLVSNPAALFAGGLQFPGAGVDFAGFFPDDLEAALDGVKAVL